VQLIFIHGPAASGKLTIARELGTLTGLGVFHNHLVVDALLEKLRFGEPKFVQLREAMWMAAFETAAKADQSLIFTFAPEPTVEPGFPERVIALIEGYGGAVRFAKLTLSEAEQEKRIADDNRREFRKLTSLDMLRQLRAAFKESEAAMPAAELSIDTEKLDPNTAARRIAAAFGLSAASAAT
jgi:hypothetical protein